MIITERLINNMANEELYEAEEEVFTLTDEEGNESDFELIGRIEQDGQTYLALEPKDNNPDGEYVILKIAVDEDGSDILVTVDDDDEFDRIADIFEDEMMSIDYDAQTEAPKA